MKLIWRIADMVRDWAERVLIVTSAQVRSWTFETPDGICDGCGGVILRIEENGIQICKGCGEVHCIQCQGNGDENPAKTMTTP